MAIKSLEQRKRQKILLIIVGGLLLIAVVILYFSIWQEGPSIPGVDFLKKIEESGSRETERLIAEKKLERISLDFDFLVETMLPFLKSHGDLPVEKGETGRDNPFIPYWLERLEEPEEILEEELEQVEELE